MSISMFIWCYFLDFFGWIATHNSVRFHISDHNTSATYNGPLPDGYSVQDDGSGSNPSIIADGDCIVVMRHVLGC